MCCKNSELVKVLNLPNTPLTDAYQKTAEEALKLKNYPLEAFYCKNCTHLQLSLHVSAEESYSNYLYKSQVTIGLKDEFVSYAKQIFHYFKKSSIKLLDVGSNDGSFLLACKEFGIDGIGVEPAKLLSEYANSKGLKTINSFFNSDFLKFITNSNSTEKFDVISFNNVLANIDNPYEALCLAKSLLKSEDSIVVVQTGYHPTLFSKGIFDYIYHEHYSYFNLKSLKTLGEKCNLNLVNYNVLPLRAGTIRCIFNAKKKESSEFIINERFNKLEEFNGLNFLIKSSKIYLNDLLNTYKMKGYYIIGYGASHSTGTLVHTMEIVSFLDLIVDENEAKYGKYMPGTSLCVENPSKIKNNSKQLVLVLAWQYYDQIKNKLLNNNFQGPIIKPILP